MSRWNQYEGDSNRLPEGMERIGYDSDTGRYLFRDRDRSTWQGPQGAEYGEMTRVSQAPEPEAQEDIEGTHLRADGYQPLAADYDKPVRQQNAYRTLAPFFLLIGVIVLLVWKLVLSYGWTEPKDPCPGSASYMVEPGDDCWEIATTHNCTLRELEIMNPNVNCGTGLHPGTIVCLPQLVPEPEPLQPV